MAKKILIVDDSSTIRGQLRFTLSQAGYEVIEAEDGQDGIAKLRANQDAAMVLCDVNMPRMNGLEMLESLASRPGTTPPVVMLTTEGAADLIARAKKAGAKGWIVKPFKPDLLLAAVKKLAGEARAA
jgi:two-component system chemotaxis response regulator CheY